MTDITRDQKLIMFATKDSSLMDLRNVSVWMKPGMGQFLTVSR